MNAGRGRGPNGRADLPPSDLEAPPRPRSRARSKLDSIELEDDAKKPAALHPSNRRVAPPKLPPDVMDAGRMSEPPPEPEGPIDPTGAERLSKPPSRLGTFVRAVVGVALVIGVSGTVAWAARRYVMTTPRFAVTTIDVSGGHHRTSDEIESTAGLARGANVFTVDLDRARAKLLADPWISEASLARRLPGTIFVQVTEREAGAIVALGDSYLASRDGEIFKRLEAGDPADLPIVTGLTPEAVAADRDATAQSIRRALDLAADYEHGPLAARAPLQEIHLEGAASVTLIVGKTAISLSLGEPPFRRKLEQASRVMTELERRGAKADTIMLDNEARPERVVVRMR